MEAIGGAARGLALVMALWAVATALAGARRDARLRRSGARGLHAAAALLVGALLARIAAGMAGLSEAPPPLALTIILREGWTDPAMRLTMWAATGALFAAAVPAVLRRRDADTRVTGQLRAGLIVLALAAGATAAGFLPPTGEDAAAPVPLHAWGGIVARLLYGLGVGAMVVPVATWHAPAARATAWRFTVAGLGALVAALTLMAHVRYASAAPPSVFDAAGAPIAPPWNTLAALWIVPPLLVAAAAFAPGGDRTARGSGAPWGGRLALLVAAVVVLAVVAPALQDWTAGDDMQAGFALHPPLLVLVGLPLLLAVLAVLVAAVRQDSRVTAAAATAGGGVLVLLAAAAGARGATTLLSVTAAGAGAGLVLLRAGATGFARERAVRFALAFALVGVGAALAATSLPPTYVEVAPGRPGSALLRGQEWRLAGQGTSQEETPAYDGSLIAFEVRDPSGARLVTPAERLYRDAHGHAAARVSVPAVLREAHGDARFVIRAMRADEVLLQVQYHPLAWLAWLSGGLVSVMLLLAAVLPGAAPAQAREEG